MEPANLHVGDVFLVSRFFAVNSYLLIEQVTQMLAMPMAHFTGGLGQMMANSALHLESGTR